MRTQPLDVLIVGAGPTGLALAAQLQRFGTNYRIIDRSRDRARESRALGVQARTLECLDAIGLGDALAARGRTSTRVVVHSGARSIATVQLGEIDGLDTRYPFILFVSQHETEQVLIDHLTSAGATIERGTELMAFTAGADDVECTLRDPAGATEQVRARYLVGCDGAHSTVRRGAAIAFDGGSYPQVFALGDVEADGPLEPGAINVFAGTPGIALFFPLGNPATWRVIALAATGAPDDRSDARAMTSALSLDELQALVDSSAERSVRVRDPAWLTRFHLHHRQTAHYRMGRVFLAGDAAHIHSPVGAQGMNTGIQDAWNLGWKLALVLRGTAHEELLDTYESERWPVGRFLLRYTDRLFSLVTRAVSAGRIVTRVRDLLLPRVLSVAMKGTLARSVIFRFVSELAIRYRASAIVEEGTPRLRRGPRAGARLPDLRLTLDGAPVFLQRAAVGAGLGLILCGDPDAWDHRRLDELVQGSNGLVVLRYVSSQPARNVLYDDGQSRAALNARNGAQYLVRPDGYIAFRAGGYDLSAVSRFVARTIRATH